MSIINILTKMEAAGVEPASAHASLSGTTCLATLLVSDCTTERARVHTTCLQNLTYQW